MIRSTQSPIFQSLSKRDLEETTILSKNEQDVLYWWNTSGCDLANMLHEARYTEDVQCAVLNYYRDVICPLLGGPPNADSKKSGAAWDGNPFSYSFELNGSTKGQGVRFIVDVSELRPANTDNPLSMSNTQMVINDWAQKLPGFDDTWYRVLKDWFVQDNLSPTVQQALITEAAQQTSAILGLDIHTAMSTPNTLPIRGKIYFPPSYVAAARGITRWQAVRHAIYRLPGIESQPNILHSTGLINDYLASKPQSWQMGIPFLATDLLPPEKSRLKVYMRGFDNSFEGIWDYYTLGGRIPNLEEDRQMFRDFVDLVSGTTYAETSVNDTVDMTRYKSGIQKQSSIYFSISADSPYPAPKFCLHPSKIAPNDDVIARGLDAWLQKYQWNDGDRSIRDQIKNVFTHRPLDEKTGIIMFIGLGRKEGPKKGLSMQVYLCPELYETPRQAICDRCKCR